MYYNRMCSAMHLTGVGAGVGARVGAGVGSGVGAFQYNHGSVSTKPHEEQIWQMPMPLDMMFILGNVYVLLESSWHTQWLKKTYVWKHQLTRVGAGVGSAVGA
jgi:hypothetical protein